MLNISRVDLTRGARSALLHEDMLLHGSFASDSARGRLEFALIVGFGAHEEWTSLGGCKAIYNLVSFGLQPQIEQPWKVDILLDLHF